jgi:hypothetical protein
VNSKVARPEATHTDGPLKSEPSIRRGFRHPKDVLTLSVSLVSVLIYALLVPASALSQSPMAVLHTEGLVHGFLVLQTLEGNTIADEKAQIAVDGPYHQYRVLRIENTLTDEHGRDVKLKKGAHVEVTITNIDVDRHN